MLALGTSPVVAVGSASCVAAPRAPSGRPATRRKPWIGEQAFALVRRADGRLLAPVVLVDPRPSLGLGNFYGGTNGHPITVSEQIAIVDPVTERVSLALPQPSGMGKCLLPRAAALDETRGELYVTCLGRDELVTYDARAAHPEAAVRRRQKVAAGPTGLAIDQAGGRAVVWSQFDRAATLVPLGKSAGESVVVAVALPPVLSPQLDLGRRLFHSAGSARVASDGRACASCHPDGRDDGLTWRTLREGERQTPMLMGRLAGTGPYGWDGGTRTLGGHLRNTIERLEGTGMSDAEREAVLAWVQSLGPPSEPGPTADAKLARGEALFHAEATGCSSCHLGDEGTDHASHDVGTASPQGVRELDTPSLRFAGRSPPYLHDGRYATVLELLLRTDGRMGHTSQLTTTEREELAAYVESL